MPEIRSLVVARWDITTPEACSQVARCAKDNNFNAIFVQVRGRGDAYYNSHLEPRSEDILDQSPDFDPLAQLLAESHEAGIQIHAWINANLTWGFMRPPVSPDHIVNKHPEWLMRTNENKYAMTFGKDVEGAYTCPTNDEWRRMYVDIYLDVINLYAVDGVHFDFIRYPSPRFCYCDRCLNAFSEQMGQELSETQRGGGRIAYPLAFPAEWDDFRRDKITRMVYSVYDAVKAAKPSVIVSASVFPTYSDAYANRFQDWKKWMRDKKIDMICPMAYSTSTATVARQTRDALDASGGIPIAVNLGSSYNTVDSCALKIRKNRQLGAAGFNLFAYSGPGRKPNDDYFAQLKDKVFPTAEYLPLANS